MSQFPRSTVCREIIGKDKDGRGIGCNKPRSEEAGWRSLCLEHWRALEQARELKKQAKARRVGVPPINNGTD